MIFSSEYSFQIIILYNCVLKSLILSKILTLGGFNETHLFLMLTFHTVALPRGDKTPKSGKTTNEI